MNRYLCIIAFFGMSSMLFSQQVPFYNHVVQNPFVFNPAMAGYSGDVNAFLVRNQRYMSYNGASVNNYLTVDGSFMNDKAGFGLQVSHQSHGIQQQLSSSLTYAYRIRLAESHDLRFGVTAGVLDNRMDLSAIDVSQIDDPYLVGLRPNVTSFDMSAGLAYSWKSLRIGFAVPQIIGNKVTYDEQNARGYYRLARHYMLSAEYGFSLSKSNSLILKPIVFVRYVPGAPVQYDVAAQLDYTKIGWVSVGYKSNYSVQMNVGFNILKQFKVGYSYEYLVGTIKNYSSGAHHEVMLGFTFGRKGKEVIKIVEKVVEVPVETAKTDEVDQEKEDLQKRNKELEELLVKTLAEKELLKEQQQELVNQKENIEKENEALVAVVKAKEETFDKDSVTETKQPVDVELEKIPYAKGYKFIDLDLGDSPDGFYVITGVYSSKKNAELALANSLKDYEGSYLVINQKNGFYYVVIIYTLDQQEATHVFKKYKRTTRKDAWILNYHSE